MQKVPKIQSGNPNLLSPYALYLYFHQHAGLSDQKKPFDNEQVSRQQRFERVISAYRTIAEKISEDLKSQFIHEEEVFNTLSQKLQSRIDNKLRVAPDGKKFMTINGQISFDGSPEAYETWFQSGKRPYQKFIKSIAEELRSIVLSETFPEEIGKAIIIGQGGAVSTEKPQETVGVDLDNTLLDQFEDPIAGAKEALEKLRDQGFKIAIYTARFFHTPKKEWQSLQSYIEALLKKAQIPFDFVSIVKPSCKFYIDDRGIKFTNWDDVIKTIETNISEDGPQDKTTSKLQQSKVGSSGVLPEEGPQDNDPSKSKFAGTSIGLREHFEETNKQAVFTILSQKDFIQTNEKETVSE